MPDTFIVNRSGVVVGREIDRSAAFQNVYAAGLGSRVGVIYLGDPHDVVSPSRINPVARAARARRDAYLASLRNCIHCGIDEEGHELFGEWGLGDPDACDDFTAPAPLAIRA